MILLNAEESRRLDQLSQTTYGIPSFLLMTRAGAAVAERLLQRWPEAVRGGVIVVAGKGNNGGDGFVAAANLQRQGVPVCVALLARASELQEDAARAYAQFSASGGPTREVSSAAVLVSTLNEQPCSVLVDAIFGTGLNKEVTGLPRRAIETLNARGLPIVAVDIASGVSSDSGAVMGTAVKADLTVTFGYARYGHVSYPGAGLCGELVIAEIGFAPEALAEIGPRGRLLDRAEIASLLPPRTADSHKGTYGHPLIIAGSQGKSGAAILAVRGALHTGAGLVTAAIPVTIAPIVAAGQAELMTEALPDHDGHFEAAAALKLLPELLQGKNAIVAGPGIGVSNDTRALMQWLVREGVQPTRPLLIDADGLNAVAALGPELLRSAPGPVVLTPHPGEMARLLATNTAAVNANRIGAARRLAELTGAVVLLKGARSVIVVPDGAISVNGSGNPGMATPGMGDVLSGIVGALLGQGLAADDALRLGVFLHGYAGDRLASRIGRVGFLAGDLALELPAAIEALRG